MIIAPLLLLSTVISASQEISSETARCIHYLNKTSESASDPDIPTVKAYLEADVLRIAPLLLSLEDDPETCKYHKLPYEYYEYDHEDDFIHIGNRKLNNFVVCCKAQIIG